MSINAGRLRYTAVISTRSTGKNAYGEQDELFTIVVPEFRCDFGYSSGSSVVEDTDVYSSTVMFKGRFREVVKRGMYLEFRGLHYIVRDVQPDRMMRNMTLVCEVEDGRLKTS